MTRKLQEKPTEKTTGNTIALPSAPTYPRRETLQIGYVEATLAAKFKKDANTGHRTAEDFATATVNFESFYESWQEKQALLIEAREAVALVEFPPTYAIQPGNNLLFDSLLDQLERSDSEKRRLEVLALAKEKLAGVEAANHYLYCGTLWYALLADHFDEQALWEPWQKKYNAAIAVAESILEQASAAVAAAKAPSIQAVLANKIHLPGGFSLSDRSIPRWTGDAAKGYSRES